MSEPVSRASPTLVHADGAERAEGDTGRPAALLAGHDLIAGYGARPILNGCSIAVGAGEIAVIVGPNGAGKSTAMKALLGLLPLASGRVTLAGDDIGALAPQARVARGIAFVPQTANVFPNLTVDENLEMGAYLRRDDVAETLEDVRALFPILAEKRRQPAGQLSGGQRQQVAVARALMTRPSVLMLDEPTAGVSPIVVAELLARIVEVRNRGLAVLMVEQNARQALEIADAGYVLVEGRNAYTDTGTALLADPDVRRAFLGMRDGGDDDVRGSEGAGGTRPSDGGRGRGADRDTTDGDARRGDRAR